MNDLNRVSRHDATRSDAETVRPDATAYSLTVLEAVLAFEQEGLAVTERTIQRYWHSGTYSSLHSVRTVLRTTGLGEETKCPIFT